MVDLNAVLFRSLASNATIRRAALTTAVREGIPTAEDLWSLDGTHLWSYGLCEQTLAVFSPVLHRFWSDLENTAPATVGFSVYGHSLFAAYHLAAGVKTRLPNTRVVFGGPWIAIEPFSRFLEGGPVDVVVLGEGEDLIACLCRNQRDLPAGTRVEQRGDTTWVWPNPPDVSAIAAPDYSLLDLTPYEPGAFAAISSRGCAYGCRYCSDRSITRYRHPEASAVVDEIESLVAHHGMTLLTFNDCSINSKRRHLLDICDGIIDRGIHVPWNANLTVHPNLDADTFERMARAGCRELLLGLESGSDRVLALMNKPFNTEVASRVIREAAACGIGLKLYLIAGYPGETEEDLAETARFVETHAEKLTGVLSINALHLTPGSKLWTASQPVTAVNPHFPNMTWTGDDGNTPEQRRRRVLYLTAAVNRAGLAIEQSNRPSNDRKDVARLCEGSLADTIDWFFVDGRVNLTKAGKPLLEELGVFIDWDVETTRQTSLAVPWKRTGESAVSSQTDGLEIRMRFDAEPDGLVVAVDGLANKPVTLERMKISAVLPASGESRWSVGSAHGPFPAPDYRRSRWKPIGPLDSNGRAPMDAGFDWPEQSVICVTRLDGALQLAVSNLRGRLFPVVQANCHPGVAVGYYRTRLAVPGSGFRELFAVKITVGEGTE